MAQCIATIYGKETCGKETRPGYKFCEEHSSRPKAIAEREEKGINTVIDATEVFNPEKNIQESSNGQSMMSKNIYEKTNDALERSMSWEEQTWNEMQGLPKADWYREDKTGILQPHPAIGINERAQDRVIRAVTAIAKLGIEAQAVNANKMLRELIKQCVTRALTRYGMETDEITRVRQILAEEFEKAASDAS